MGLDNFDRPAVNSGLTSATFEDLRQELNNLDLNLKEILDRRAAVRTELNARLDEGRMHVMQSEEHYAKATGMYTSTEERPVDIEQRRDTPRGGW